MGGEKVFPAEIDALIFQFEGVAAAGVSGRPHPIMGAVVQARILMLNPNVSVPETRARILRELSMRLVPFKVPQKIEITQSTLVLARFKQER